MQYLITSDLHLGSRYCRWRHVLEVLDRVPAGATLILNGDVIDDPSRALTPEHGQVLDRLVAESRRRPVIWVWGNHDDAYRPADPGQILFAPSYTIDRRLFLAHGHDFDNVMPQHQWFIHLFRRFHHLRIRLGAHPVHVAYYAKKWKMLYDFLCANVRRSAVEHAQEIGIPTVACGHTHYGEESTDNGIRYLNTGAWTEAPSYCLLVDDAGIALRDSAQLLASQRWFAAG